MNTPLKNLIKVFPDLIIFYESGIDSKVHLFHAHEMEATKTKKESYLVEGLTCSGCERTVKKVIETSKELHRQNLI